MKQLIAFFWQRKLHSLFLAMLVVSISGFSMMVPIVFSVLTDTILPKGYFPHFVLLISLLFLLILVRMLINFLQDLFFMKSRFLFEKYVFWQVLDKQLKHRVSALERGGASEVLAKISTFITNFQFNFSEIFYFLLYSLFVSSVVLSLILLTSTAFFALALLFLAVHFANLLLHKNKVKALSTAYVDEKNRFNARIDNLIASKKVINVFGLNGFMEQRVGDDVALLYQKHHARERLVNRQELVQSLLKNLLFILMLLVGVVAVREQQLTMALVLLCILLIGFVYDPVYRLNAITKAYADCKAQLTALLDEIEFASTEAEEATYFREADVFCEPLPVCSLHDIELRDLSLKYQDKWLFQHVNALLHPGKIYLLDGPSGAGKSSLLRLIAGLEQPTQGEVYWNQLPVSHFLKTHRPSLSLCPQQVCWAEASIADNVSLFSSDPDASRLAQALAHSGCDFIETSALYKEPRSPETWSGGQLRRLGVARSFYANASVFLLDEPTANLDAVSEQKIIDQLRTLAESAIVIVCSHSPALRAVADERILVSPLGGNDKTPSASITGGATDDC